MTKKTRPSELLKDALQALSYCEKSRKYRIDMNVWYEPDFVGAGCSVCLAGSVMAKRLKSPSRTPSEQLVFSDESHLPRSPWFYPEKERKMLMALNSLRMGYIGEALRTLGVKRTHYQVPRIQPVVEYDESPTAWRADMETLVEILEEAGL